VPGRLGRPIGTVIASIPVPGRCGRDSKNCTKIGEATLPNRQRNRPEEGERKNDPIQVRCTPMDRCSKKSQIVRRNPALWHARDAFHGAQLEPHISSSQGDPIRQVYIRVTSKPGLTNRPRLADDFGPMFTYLIHPSSFRLHPSAQGIAPPNAYARRLHYFHHNRRKACHRDHQHKTSDTRRAARKCG